MQQQNEEFIQIAVRSNPMILIELPREIKEKKEIIQLAKQFYGIGEDINAVPLLEYDQEEQPKKRRLL